MMTKKLLLFRHAKSSWDSDTSADWERPLSKRGQSAAQAMGQFLTQAEQLPDTILSSSAVRARTTVELAAQAGRWQTPIQTTDALYEAEPRRVLALIHQQSADCRTLMIVGHEPTCSELIAALIGGGQLQIPTGAIARLDFEVAAWSQVQFALGILRWLITPKLLLSAKNSLETD